MRDIAEQRNCSGPGLPDRFPVAPGDTVPEAIAFILRFPPEPVKRDRGCKPEVLCIIREQADQAGYGLRRSDLPEGEDYSAEKLAMLLILEAGDKGTGRCRVPDAGECLDGAKAQEGPGRLQGRKEVRYCRSADGNKGISSTLPHRRIRVCKATDKRRNIPYGNQVPDIRRGPEEKVGRRHITGALFWMGEYNAGTIIKVMPDKREEIPRCPGPKRSTPSDPPTPTSGIPVPASREIRLVLLKICDPLWGGRAVY